MTDYSELVKALRCCTQNPPETCVGCTYNIGNNECAVRGMMCDAAAAIEALQAELEKKRTADCWGCKCEKIEPKRGEWIVREVDSPGEMHPVAFRCMCSMCLNEYVFPRIPKYCPDCGSMNTAKMEVQE